MPLKPTEHSPKHIRHLTAAKDAHNIAQYGTPPHQPFSLLLALPAESLTHITSFLDPVSLLLLSQVNRRLSEHLKDDATWRRAFLCQFLGIRPEDDLMSEKSLLLRRSEPSWRKEFISRWKLRRRWERSRTQAIVHIPHHARVSGLHLASESGLLTSSLFYGIVARSVPLTGKVHKGFIGAADRQNGMGVGNPNAEFSPDVSACAITSEGSHARIFWGFRSGSVAIVHASQISNTASRPSTTVTRCHVNDQHEGEVKDISWIPGQPMAISAGADGTVKLWQTKTLECVWTSPKKPRLVPIDIPFVKIAAAISQEVMVAGQADGEVVAWNSVLGNGDSHEVRIPLQHSEGSTEPIERKAPMLMFVDATESTQCAILVVHDNDTLAHRFDVDFTQESFTHTLFGDGATGIVTTIQPSFAAKANERSFVAIGDAFGFVRIFPWETSPHVPVIPSRVVEAFPDGDAVTSLTFNLHVLAAGSSSNGSVRVFDALSLTPLRTIHMPGISARAPPEPVTHLALDREMVVAGVGTRVMAWKAGPVSSHVAKHVAKPSKKVNREMKGQQQFDLKRDLRESRAILANEQQHTKVAFGRERDQRSALHGLGLNEIEAVDYVLQLSRDEEEARRLHAFEAGNGDVFEGDFDALDLDTLATPMVERAEPPMMGHSLSWSASGTRSLPAPPSTASRSPPSDVGTPVFLSSASGSAPRLISRIMEPRVAGFTSDHVDASPAASVSLSDTFSEEAHFPILSRTPSSAGASVPGTPPTRSVSVSPQWSRLGSPPVSRTPGSPTSSRGTGSAWSTPLRHRVPAPALAHTRSEPTRADRPLSFSPPRFDHSIVEEDEELRFALELSLAEARSRGETV